jgi:cytoskeletal protein CcmA (bactofilin family)
MAKTRKAIILLLFVVLLLPAAALAFTTKAGNSINVGKGETIDGNFFAAGQNIQIEGKVNGDVFCAGQSVNINGEVAGDVICAASSINVNGKVGGNLRAAASSIILNGSVSRNLMAAAASISTGASSSIGWEALTAAATGDFRGRIGRDLVGAGAAYTLGGTIGRNVRLWLDGNKNNDKYGDQGLKIENDARINGMLTYTSKNDAQIASGAKITGETKRLEPKVRQTGNRDGGGIRFLGTLYSIIATLIIGLVLVKLWAEEIKKIITFFTIKGGSTFGWGLIILIITPIIGLLLLITIIGAPLTILLMMVWAIALTLSKIFVGIFVGQKLLERFWQAKKESLYAALTIGVVVTYIVFAIPVLGWLLSALALIWGLGAIYLYFRKT